MSDQWSGAEDDLNRLKNTPGTGSTSNAGAGAASTRATGAGTSGIEQALGSADMTGIGSQGDSSPGMTGKMDKAKEALSGMTEKAGDIGSQATSRADAGMEKAAEGLDALASRVRDRGESMGEGQVASLATAAADKMHTGAEMIRGKDTDQLMTDLEALIRRRPVESLLVAAGIGYLISRAK
jgi:hypothetical protein